MRPRDSALDRETRNGRTSAEFSGEMPSAVGEISRTMNTPVLPWSRV
jgi:hypothetical protein